MKTKVNSRSSNDERWQEVKKIVRERDNYTCRLCSCLTAAEYNESRKAIHLSFEPTDCAHVEAAGYDPAKMYNPENILFMCRAHHSCLDNLINPFTGRHMDDNFRWYLWWRAKYQSTRPYSAAINWHEYYYQKEKTEKKSQSSETLSQLQSTWW